MAITTNTNPSSAWLAWLRMTSDGLYKRLGIRAKRTEPSTPSSW